MPNADRGHALAACGSAIRSDTPMPPAARLYLARASLFTDPKGRTNYGPARYATDCREDPETAERAVAWLLAAGLLTHDHNDAGLECWRLTHYDWTRDTTPTINGYSADAGMKRDGYPASYSRRVDDVIEPPTGNLNYQTPPWEDIAEQIAGSQDHHDSWASS